MRPERRDAADSESREYCTASGTVELPSILPSSPLNVISPSNRAISSIALNTAEGFGVSAGNGRLRFETARGSLMEAEAGVRIAVAWGYVSEAAAAELLASMHVLGGRIYGMVRR